jgi:adenine-specific DNA-methyltransferase
MVTRKKSTPKAPTSASQASAGESAIGSYKPVDSLKHDKGLEPVQRLHIPSREEAGQEADAVADKPTVKGIGLNPVTHRGQDPELFWMHKYGNDDQQKQLEVDIRSLYRHEHIAPEKIIARLYSLKGKTDAQNELFVNELFGNPLAMDELDKPLSYYKQPGNWQNRLIQGDSLLTMTSLLEREGMAGQVQCVYMDPPYGIKYGSNWQMRLNDRNVKDGADENLSGEPEVIKAFRDTWELGIHSYLSYLRDRLLVAKELLSTSGSCFVQISDENVHLVRCLMDEVFGSENFVAQINYKSMMPLESGRLESVFDYVIWFAKSKDQLKYRNLYVPKNLSGNSEFVFADTTDGDYRKITSEEKETLEKTVKDLSIFKRSDLNSSGYTPSCTYPIEFKGKVFESNAGKSWRTTKNGVQRLIEKNRLFVLGTRLYYKMYFNDFPYTSMVNSWNDTIESESRQYVVQTTRSVIARCILMTTDPGDLVLDPTCGSGTTAYVAEQWGRRWITSDTSRIALNIAKTRLMTATFPWYKLVDVSGQDVRHGFVYKTVPHVTLKSLANDEPPETETLYDQPELDKKKLRVAGPFTVETLQNFEPTAPEDIAEASVSVDKVQRFLDNVFEHLKTAGIKTGAQGETAVFSRVDIINDDSGALHAEGWYAAQANGQPIERKAYLHIGPQFGTVSKQAANEALKACRQRADADWLVLLGFGFESDVDSRVVNLKVGSFQVTKARMHDDLMQDGLIKKDKKAASFVTIGEPDIGLVRSGDTVVVEIRGLDIYDPIQDILKPRSVSDINFWMLDDDYDGSNFVPTQVFFCGGEKDEFDKFKRGLSQLAAASIKKNAERTLKIEMDDEAFGRVYGHISHPVPSVKGKKLAVRVVSQFGEECTKVLTL